MLKAKPGHHASNFLNYDALDHHGQRLCQPAFQAGGGVSRGVQGGPHLWTTLVQGIMLLIF